MTEITKTCKCCNKEKTLSRMKKNGMCNVCFQKKELFSIEDFFWTKKEKELIPAVLKDIEFLKQKAKETGLLE